MYHPLLWHDVRMKEQGSSISETDDDEDDGNDDDDDDVEYGRMCGC